MCEKLLSSGHSSCVAMVISVLFMPLTMSSSTVSSSLCNITEVIIPALDSGNYFSVEHDNSCFVFALKLATVTEAIKNCIRLGGHLTDIEKRSGSKLQNYINQEKERSPQIHQAYWIGLLYNGDLGSFYWVNDADLKQSEFIDLRSYLRLWYGNCIVMNNDTFTNSECKEVRPFICKLDLECLPLVANSTGCSERCVAFIKSHMTNRTSDPNTTEEVYNNNNNDTISSVNKNATADCSSKEQTLDSVDECKPSPKQADTQNVVIVAVLGGIVTILTVALGVACAIIFKYRRLLRTMEQSPRISLVDILNADQSETRITRPRHHSGSHHGSATELLYSSADGTGPDPNKIDRQAVTTSDIIYHNHNSLRGAGMHSVTSETNPEKENNVYSHLNHSGANPDNEGSRAVYDINSASDLQEQEEKSPTYEQY